jgi:hypothetical protein
MVRKETTLFKKPISWVWIFSVALLLMVCMLAIVGISENLAVRSIAVGQFFASMLLGVLLFMRAHRASLGKPADLMDSILPGGDYTVVSEERADGQTVIARIQSGAETLIVRHNLVSLPATGRFVLGYGSDRKPSIIPIDRSTTPFLFGTRREPTEEFSGSTAGRIVLSGDVTLATQRPGDSPSGFVPSELQPAT